jgi:hypothetical protein
MIAPTMIAIELTGRIDHGQVTLSTPAPVDWEGRQVRAIIMTDEPLPQRRSIPLPTALTVLDFVPLRRDDIYDRA